MSADLDSKPEVLFRPSKRRKYLRRRPGLEDTQEDTQEETQASDDACKILQAQGGDSPRIPRTDVARFRRLHRPRKGGIEFSAGSRATTENGNQMALSTIATGDIENERMRAMSDRFTAHTGQTVDVDKHMKSYISAMAANKIRMTYIETEMAKRYRHGTSGDLSGQEAATPSEVGSSPSTTGLPQRQPASLGKLHEIDLGQETKLQNIARTEAATRMLNDDDRFQMGDFNLAPQAKDEGYRNRKRRTSADVERDRLVEEVLRESKLDVYDEAVDQETAGDDQAADDRVAEQFRRDFLDAIQSRRRVARAKNTKQNKPEVPRGPKLGGSRSARAAMREAQDKSGRK